MNLKQTKLELNQDDLNTLKDIVFNALGKENLSNKQIYRYWDSIPLDIKLDALKWGVSDTPTRESIYTWIQENYK